MKKNTLHKDIYGYSKEILLYCNKVSGKYHKKTLHKLRVNFKTLRALLRWQHADSEKLLTPFRSIYHAAGDIRNADLVLDFIVAHKIHLPACKQWLTMERKKHRQSWRKVYHKKETEEWVKLIKALAIKYRQNDLFFNNKLKDSRKIVLNKPLTDEHLHQIRKNIKDMQYAARWSSKQEISITPLKNYPVEKLKEMTTRIGDYNDLGMVIAMLELFLKENQHSVEAKKVALIRTQCLQKKRKEKPLLVRYIKEQLLPE